MWTLICHPWCSGGAFTRDPITRRQACSHQQVLSLAQVLLPPSYVWNTWKPPCPCTSLAHSSFALDPPSPSTVTEPTCPAEVSHRIDSATFLFDQIQTWTLLHPSATKQTPDIKVWDRRSFFYFIFYLLQSVVFSTVINWIDLSMCDIRLVTEDYIL